MLIPIIIIFEFSIFYLTQTNMSAISRFHQYAVKRIPGLPITFTTRSDMAELMVGINRPLSKIEYRKLMFLHKLMSPPSDSVLRNVFIKKMILLCNIGFYTRYMSIYVQIYMIYMTF